MINQLYNLVPQVVSTEEVERLLSLRGAASSHHDDDGHSATALQIPFLAGWLNRRLAGTFGDRFKRFDFCAGSGGVHPHTDRDSRGYTRSVLIFLDADYQGGLTWFDDTGRCIHAPHPSIGDVLLFDHRILHWGDPVSAGRKIVMKGDWR